jgi:hypothetical protein
MKELVFTIITKDKITYHVHARHDLVGETCPESHKQGVKTLAGRIGVNKRQQIEEMISRTL